MTLVPTADEFALAVRRKALAQRQRRKLAQLVLGIGFPLLLLALWELLVWQGFIDRRFFPPPSKIVTGAVALLGDTEQRKLLGIDLLASAHRLLWGYGLGSLLGTIAGITMGLSLPLRFALGPLVSATYPTPKLAIFPLMIVIFGLGDASKVALITLGVFYMSCMSTLSGVLYSAPIYRDVARAFRMPAWTRWTKVVIPSALPAIVTGLKLGLGQALILVVSAEFVSSQDGIGHFIWDSWQVLDISRMFVGLVIVGIAGGAAVLLGEFFEYRLTPWANHSR